MQMASAQSQDSTPSRLIRSSAAFRLWGMRKEAPSISISVSAAGPQVHETAAYETLSVRDACRSSSDTLSGGATRLPATNRTSLISFLFWSRGL